MMRTQRAQAVRAPWWAAAAAFVIALAVPVVFTLAGVRAVMSHAFLYFEYNRPGFPADPYGFTTEDRLRYAPLAVDYLLNGAPIRFLGDQTFPDGTPLYNARELRHMHDVQIVTTAAYAVGLALFALAALAAAALWRRGLHGRLLGALTWGAMLALGLIAAIVIGAALAWDTFFTLFHEVFFADGTWYFPYSDTLIRLFPEAFWFDAALVIGGFVITASLVLLGAAWAAGRRLARRVD
jgi:integral membrane protein (TIGR01906 family)